ncbi:MAG TPA: hypothetical protein VGA80_12925 [Flavobacteriaceae bacterium]
MKEHLEVFFQNPWSYIFAFILLGLFYYFKKKLENLADKSDIANITREVESVKSEFNADLEKLKVNLDVLKSNRINQINEKRKAIYTLWISLANLNNKLDSFFGVNIKDESDCITYCQEIDIQYFEFHKELTVFELILIEEIGDDFKEILNQFMVALMNKEKAVKNGIIELGKFKLSDTNKSIDRYTENLIQVKNQVEIQNETYFRCYNSLKDKLSKFLKRIHENS